MRTDEHAAYRRRWEELPPAIQKLAHRNVVVDKVATEYALGHICFMNEALAQMVVGLGQNWEGFREQAYRDHMVVMQQAQPCPEGPGSSKGGGGQ